MYVCVCLFVMKCETRRTQRFPSDTIDVQSWPCEHGRLCVQTIDTSFVVQVVLGLSGIFVPGYPSGIKTGTRFSGIKIATYPPQKKKSPLRNFYIDRIATSHTALK